MPRDPDGDVVGFSATACRLGSASIATGFISGSFVHVAGTYP